MNWAELINEVTSLFRKRRLEELQYCNVRHEMDGSVFADPASQSDKPSPSSFLHLTDLYGMMLEDWPYPAYKVWLVANTNSMEPIIDANSVIVCEDFTSKAGKTSKGLWPLRVGDICIYKGNEEVFGKGTFVIHQIVKIRSDGKLIFKGINNFKNDPLPVHPSDVVGRAFIFASARQERAGD